MIAHRDGRIEFRFYSDDPADRDFIAGLNALIDANNQNRATDGPGTYLVRAARGTSNRVRPASSPVPAPLTPLHGYDASVGSTPQVGIIIGTVQGVIPPISGTPLTPYVTPAPESGLPAAPVLSVASGSGIVYVQISVAVDGSFTLDTQFIGGSTLPDNVYNNDGSAVGYYPLFFTVAQVVSGKASVTVAQNVLNSISYILCGGQFYIG